MSRTLCGCVDWNTEMLYFDKTIIVAPYVGVWIETGSRPPQAIFWIRRTLCGCVDWNMLLIFWTNLITVAPYVGVWIETYGRNIVKTIGKSHPMWVRRLKPI